MMNIVFLDIDGVLNHGQFGKDENDKFGFADDCIQNLKYILDEVSDCKIVISSAWKHFTMQGLVDQDTRDWRQTLCSKLGISRDTIIDDTPDTEQGSKECEIAEWLGQNKHKVSLGTYVILDDECTNMRKMFPNNVVDCDIKTGEGLSKRKADEAIWILSGFKRDKRRNITRWLTADTHFFHANIIKYCNRPFADVDEMNKALIERWNALVKPDDIVWHLGDFCFGKKENVQEVLPKLNGQISLVLGNHDHHKMQFYYDAGFKRVYDRPVLIDGFFLLSHAPIEWISDSNPFANIFGHVHDSEVYKTFTARSACVCVERWNYAPVKWDDIVAEMKAIEDIDKGVD